MTSKKICTFLCFLLFFLTSCASRQTKQLDAIFSEKLKVDPALLQTMDAEIQNPKVTKEYDDVSFQIGQTFGDEKFLYISFDVTFNNKQDFDKFISEDNVSKLNIVFIDKKETDIVLPLLTTSSSPFNIHLSTYSILNDKNTISYLIALTPTNFLYSFETITLYISDITVTSHDGEKEILASGPYFISWDAANKGTLYSGEIQDADTDGTVLLSSFGLMVYLDRSGYTSLEDLKNSITITQGGKTFPLPSSVSGGYSPSTGSCHLILPFPELLNLNQLDSMQLGDQTIDFFNRESDN